MGTYKDLLSSDTLSNQETIMQFESELNDLSLTIDVKAGHLCCHGLTRWIMKRKGYTFKSFVGQLFWFLKRIGKTQINDFTHLMIASTNEKRFINLFSPILDHDKYSHKLIFSNSFYQGIHLRVFLKWVVSIMPDAWKFMKTIRHMKSANSRTLNLKNIEMLYVYTIQSLKFLVAKDFLKKNEITSILVDFDRSANISPLMLAAKKAGVKTATLVHGSVLPPYLFLPVLANTMYCWGNIQKELFGDLVSDPTSYIISGRTDGLNTHQIKPKKIDEDSKLIMTFISSNYSDKAQFEVIRRIGQIKIPSHWEICVRAHQAEDISLLQSICDVARVKLLDIKESLMQCFENSDVIMVIDSTVCFDAIKIGIPVLFWAMDDNHIDLPNLFEAKAEAVVVKQVNDLEHVLTGNHSQSDLKVNLRYEKLLKFNREYITYEGEEAALRILEHMGQEYSGEIKEVSTVQQN